MNALHCPTCGQRPLNPGAAARMRLDLATLWLSLDDAGDVVPHTYCQLCWPRAAAAEGPTCRRCGDGVLLSGVLADPENVDFIRAWLVNHGWIWSGPTCTCPNCALHLPGPAWRDTGSGQRENTASTAPGTRR